VYLSEQAHTTVQEVRTTNKHRNCTLVIPLFFIVFKLRNIHTLGKGTPVRAVGIHTTSTLWMVIHRLRDITGNNTARIAGVRPSGQRTIRVS